MGCPVLNLTNGCTGSFVQGERHDLGDFNMIGSIIKSQYKPKPANYLRCQEDGTYNGTTYCLFVDSQSKNHFSCLCHYVFIIYNYIVTNVNCKKRYNALKYAYLI